MLELNPRHERCEHEIPRAIAALVSHLEARMVLICSVPAALCNLAGRNVLRVEFDFKPEVRVVDVEGGKVQAVSGGGNANDLTLPGALIVAAHGHLHQAHGPDFDVRPGKRIDVADSTHGDRFNTVPRIQALLPRRLVLLRGRPEEVLLE